MDKFFGVAGRSAAALPVGESKEASVGGIFGKEVETFVDLLPFGGDLCFGPFLLPIGDRALTEEDIRRLRRRRAAASGDTVEKSHFIAQRKVALYRSVEFPRYIVIDDGKVC